MSGYANQFTRVQVLSTRYEGGQLLVKARGMAGEEWDDLVWYDAHGFHSRPKKGAIGMILAPGGRRDQAMVMAAADPGKVPALEEGESVMYDAGGNTVTLKADGWHFSTDLHIDGNVTITGNLHANGSVTDGDGDGGA